jgi:hypothetical protein
LLDDRSRHVLGDRPPHAVVRDVVRRKLPRLGGRRLADADHGRGGDGAIDILAGDSAVAAGSLDAGRVDAVLQACPAD